MTDINHTGRADGSPKTSHDTLHMNVEFFETNSWEQRVGEHFYVLSYKNVWDNKNAIESSPLFLWYFNAIFHQID